MPLFQSLRNRSFAFLWAGQTGSMFGDRLSQIALIWWVLVRTGSGAAMASVDILATIAALVCLPVAGVIVDRMARKRVMIIVDSIRAVISGAIAVLVWTDRLDMPTVYLCTIVWGAVSAFFVPAFGAIVPELVTGDELTSANALLTVSGEVTGLAGPALGAAMVAGGLTALAFACDALSFIVSAVCIVRVGDVKVPERRSRPDMARELREGLSVVRAEPWLWITMIVFGAVAAIDASLLYVAMPYSIEHSLDLGVGSFAVVVMATGLGSVLCASWLGRHPVRRRRGLVIYGGMFVLAASFLAMGLSPAMIGIAVAVFLRGGAINAASLVWTETVQVTVPRDVFGRVTSTMGVALSAAAVGGYWACGWAADHFSRATVFVAAAVLTSGLALLALVHPRIRSFD